MASARRRANSKTKAAASPRIGVLHLVIAASVLMLSVRIGTLYEDLNGWVGSIEVGQSQALAVEANPPARAGPESEPTTTSPGQGGDAAVAPTSGAPSMASQAATGLTPPGFTQSEINLLQRLAERREEIDAMDRELRTREALLQAAEGRIGTRIEELKDLEQMIKDLLAEHSAQEQARIDQLVSIYATMKPKDAARIFNTLDMPILLRVIETMKERSSAAIMAQMTPERAKEVTTELARRRSLPGSDTMTDCPQAAAR